MKEFPTFAETGLADWADAELMRDVMILQTGMVTMAPAYRAGRLSLSDFHAAVGAKTAADLERWIEQQTAGGVELARRLVKQGRTITSDQRQFMAEFIAREAHRRMEGSLS